MKKPNECKSRRRELENEQGNKRWFRFGIRPTFQQQTRALTLSSIQLLLIKLRTFLVCIFYVFPLTPCRGGGGDKCFYLNYMFHLMGEQAFFWTPLMRRVRGEFTSMSNAFLFHQPNCTMTRISRTRFSSTCLLDVFVIFFNV